MGKTMIPTLLLAAGQSSRMGGRDKLLEHVDGIPILRLLACRVLSVGPLFVTVPATDHPRRVVLPQAARIIEVLGEMSDSIKAGITALPDTATGVIILPADMPDIEANDIQTIKTHAETTNAKIVRATTKSDEPGHPIYLSASLFEQIATLSGDTGAGQILKSLIDQTTFVPLNGERARLDLDTPADWENYRKSRVEQSRS